ncbi:MAG: hypothetical protein LKJ47_06175 [Bifidobacteriaceae bacterium]|nr:hypothetical protein [Bifidobacteriaceae bacterium]
MLTAVTAALAAVCLTAPLAGCGVGIDSSGIHFNTASSDHAAHPDKAPELEGSWQMRSYKMKDSFGQKITIDPNSNSTLTFADGVLTNNQMRTHSWDMKKVNYSVSKEPDANGYYTITFSPNGQKKPSKPAIYMYEIVHVTVEKQKGLRFRPVLDEAVTAGADGQSMQQLVNNGAKQDGDYYVYDYYAACPWFQGFEEHIPSACAINPKTSEISETGNSTIYPASAKLPEAK